MPEAENTVVTEHDVTGHAELNLVRRASMRFEVETLEGVTLYTSTEPCAMCSSAIYWSGIGRVVYALGSEGSDGDRERCLGIRNVGAFLS